MSGSGFRQFEEVSTPYGKALVQYLLLDKGQIKVVVSQRVIDHKGVPIKLPDVPDEHILACGTVAFWRLLQLNTDRLVRNGKGS